MLGTAGSDTLSFSSEAIQLGLSRDLSPNARFGFAVGAADARYGLQGSSGQGVLRGINVGAYALNRLAPVELLLMAAYTRADTQLKRNLVVGVNANSLQGTFGSDLVAFRLQASLPPAQAASSSAPSLRFSPPLVSRTAFRSALLPSPPPSILGCRFSRKVSVHCRCPQAFSWRRAGASHRPGP